MNSIYQLITGVLLFCSLSGYMLFARTKLKLQTEFVPVFVFSAIGCAVYFFGLAGYLFPGSVILLVIGAILSGVFIYGIIDKKQYQQIRLSLFGVAFAIGSVYFFHGLFISRLIHYDNFSHWALVIKQMLSTNAFPDASSALIDFKNYPLGTSSFIYFFCRFTVNSQPVMLMAQGILIFSCFYAMFGIIEETKRFLLYAFLASGCSLLSLFNATIRITNLLVDFLLPVYALVLLAIAYRYQRNIKKACILMAPIAGLLMIVKNTGIIYGGVGFLFLLYLWIKNREKSLWKSGLMIIFSIGTAMIPYILWSWHVKVAFQGIKNKFDISAGNIQNVNGGKTPEEVRQIISLFLKSVFDITSRPTMGVIVFNIMAIISSIFAVTVLKKRWNLWKAVIALDLILMVYYLGILALYIFSMPTDEAMRLAGFERYASSIVVLFVGGLLLCATVDMEHSFYYKIGDMPAYRAYKSVESKIRYQEGIILCLVLAVTLLMSEYNGMMSIQGSYRNTLPYKVYTVTGDRWYLDGRTDEKRYLFYASDTDSQVTDYYLQYIGKYMLYAPNVDGICAFYEENMMNLLSNYDYLVIVESDAPEKHLMKKYFHIPGQAGIYKIITAGDTLTLEPVS